MTRHGLALVQAAYYGATALWPMLHLNSFLRVTGPKVDLWLVRCVAHLILVVALSLLAAAVRGELGDAAFVLGCASALALGSTEAYYAARGTIAKIYLADALLELLLIAGWIFLRG